MRPFNVRAKHGRTIVETLRDHGPLTLDQAIKIHKLFGPNRCKTLDFYVRAMDAGWIEMLKPGVYSLSCDMRREAAKWATAEEPAAATAPAYRPPFKPLSLAHLPSAAPRRPECENQPERSMHYAGTSAEPTMRGVSLA